MGMSERNYFMQNLREGDDVYWYDPDDDVCSGMYTVDKIYDKPEDRCEETIVVIRNTAGSEVEAYMDEIA